MSPYKEETFTGTIMNLFEMLFLASFWAIFGRIKGFKSGLKDQVTHKLVFHLGKERNMFIQILFVKG